MLPPPQSIEHVVWFSPMDVSHNPLPHTALPPLPLPQSCGHECASLAAQMLSPHTIGAASGIGELLLPLPQLHAPAVRAARTQTIPVLILIIGAMVTKR